MNKSDIEKTRLTKREKEVATLFYVEKLSAKEISELKNFGLNGQKIGSPMIMNILKKVRNKFERRLFK